MLHVCVNSHETPPCSLLLLPLGSIREVVLVRSLRRLREQIVRANLLVQEASFISEELERHTEYRVTLQIPSDNLNANRKVSLHTCTCTHTHAVHEGALSYSLGVCG